MARTDPTRPQGWATCSRCGFIGNLIDFKWQFDWRGQNIVNLKFLVCPPCYDLPSEAALRTIVLPADPLPLMNARPEPYSIDETDFFVGLNGAFIVTQSGANLVPLSG